jgi:hypothetical protein
LIDNLANRQTIIEIGCMYLASNNDERELLEGILKNRKKSFEYESRLAASVLYPLLSVPPDMAACRKLYREKQDRLRQSVSGVTAKVWLVPHTVFNFAKI